MSKNYSFLNNCLGYLAPKNYEAHLRKELAHKSAKIIFEHGSLLFVEKPSQGNPLNIYWKASEWKDIHVLNYESVKKCAVQLKKINRFWYFYSPTLHLRSKLIVEQLPKWQSSGFKFPLEHQNQQLTSSKVFSLLSADQLVYAQSVFPSFPNGEEIFMEDKVNPPCRAYLKLQEAFFQQKDIPKENDYVIELGAAPGGWTYVLQQLGANILSCDRTQLDPSLMKYKNMKFISSDAFKILPDSHATSREVDWLLSDLICYPDKLLKFVKEWIDSGRVNNVICTIKFQGDIDFDIIDRFAEIPNSQIVHLPSNKNELTFLWKKNEKYPIK